MTLPKDLIHLILQFGVFCTCCGLFQLENNISNEHLEAARSYHPRVWMETKYEILVNIDDFGENLDFSTHLGWVLPKI